MNLEAIAGWLQTKNCGTVGESLFVTEMPEDCREGTLLIGNYRGTPIDHYMPGYYVAVFRTIIRGEDYESAKALANRVKSALNSHAGYELPGLSVKQCLVMNLPRVYRKSVGGFWEFEFDSEIVFIDEIA